MFNQFISFLENDTLYSTPKLSDLHALSQRKQLENHTRQGGTYLHSPYLAVHTYIHTYTLLMLPKWTFKLNRIKKNTNI